ncbi:MAG: cyclase family protein [Candidatus Thiodiazotropha sp.]
MPLHDVSLIISEESAAWPGDPPILLKKISQIQNGALANVTHISAPVHMGTHVDAPDHFLGNGETVETIPLDYLVGPARVVDVPSRKIISANDLSDLELPSGTERVLFKTANSEFWKQTRHSFQEDFIALGADAASRLVEMGVKVVGIDYLSIAPYDDPLPTHRILLKAGVLIIEGLDLSRVNAGEYQLYCLPLKIQCGDGAPARVLLED